VIKEISRTKVDAPPSPPQPFQIGCAPPGAEWDDDRTFLFSSETDDEDLKKVKELLAQLEELNAQVAKYNEVSFSCRFILCDEEVSYPNCSLLKNSVSFGARSRRPRFYAEQPPVSLGPNKLKQSLHSSKQPGTWSALAPRGNWTSAIRKLTLSKMKGRHW
jgi:hypothetical protein